MSLAAYAASATAAYATISTAAATTHPMQSPPLPQPPHPQRYRRSRASASVAATPDVTSVGATSRRYFSFFQQNGCPILGGGAYMNILSPVFIDQYP